jgi:hypothetical protein
VVAYNADSFSGHSIATKSVMSYMFPCPYF